MTWHIYSTLSASTQYVTYRKNDSREMAIAEKRITIKGGANVASKNLITPRGVVTTVSDEDYAELMQNPVFLKHLEGHYIFCDPVKANANKVAEKNMEARDVSAPLTPDDPKFQNVKGKGVRVREDSKGSKGKL